MTRRALLSVSDKAGLVPFAQRLVEAGYAIVSTGGTYRTLVEHGVAATYVTELTGFPEILDGRVKTLHPVVHGGILHRRDLPSHVAQAAAHGIDPIDVVVVNLYPFAATVAQGAAFEDAIEQIDIGGPAMVRAAAKNHAGVTVVVRPQDYDRVADAIAAGGPSPGLRRELALAAFEHTASYDAAIAQWLRSQTAPEPLPQRWPLALEREATLRYGENPQQAAALYRPPLAAPWGGAEVLGGKELSYNNLLDTDAAVEAVREFDEAAVVIVKHTNPCGVGRDAGSLRLAWDRALAADPVSAFGGVVATNRPVTADVAAAMSEIFLEVVAAPAFEPEALTLLSHKKALRLLVVPPVGDALPRLRSTTFGLLAQSADPAAGADFLEARVMTERAPTEAEWVALRFAWQVSKHVKSNAIVLSGSDRTWGVGAGQMSRVESVRIAVSKAGPDRPPLVLASDAFFPFRDGLDVAGDAGITAVVQPGGSRRDDEVIAAANERGMAMVFVGRRHFRH